MRIDWAKETKFIEAINNAPRIYAEIQAKRGDKIDKMDDFEKQRYILDLIEKEYKSAAHPIAVFEAE